MANWLYNPSNTHQQPGVTTDWGVTNNEILDDIMNKALNKEATGTEVVSADLQLNGTVTGTAVSETGGNSKLVKTDSNGSIVATGNVKIGSGTASFREGGGLHIVNSVAPSIRLQDSNTVNSDFEINVPSTTNVLNIYHVNTDTDLAQFSSSGGLTLTGGLTINDDTLIKTTSSSALDIQNAGGTSSFVVDTSSNRIKNFGILNLGNGSELTISSGAITINSSYHFVDTESDASTDDLDNINGGEIGDILIIRNIDASRSVIAKDNTGNLKLNGDFTLDNPVDILMLIKMGTSWTEISRSNNG